MSVVGTDGQPPNANPSGLVLGVVRRRCHREGRVTEEIKRKIKIAIKSSGR